MKFDELKAREREIHQIANKYGIRKVYIFGSIARGESSDQSDIDFLVDMEEHASFLGVGGFSYEIEKLLGVKVDVIPLSILSTISDTQFSKRVQAEAVAL